jgi:hypothetical protein
MEKASAATGIPSFPLFRRNSYSSFLGQAQRVTEEEERYMYSLSLKKFF